MVTVSGNDQTGMPGTFAAEPLLIELTYPGLPGDPPIPVLNGIVTAQMTQANGGQISLTNDGAGLATALSLRTGVDGRVTVYFKHPDAIPPLPALRGIEFKIGSAVDGYAQKTFTFSLLSRILYTYPAGTVGRHMSEAIDTRLAAALALVSPATAKLIFSTQVHEPTPNYVRNTDSWCYDLRQQMTCISPWNSDGQNLAAGTAITPQHIVNSAHVQMHHDYKVRFITANNVVEERFIRGIARHPDYDVTLYPDLTVYTLDSPLPVTITPCKILPASYAGKLSYLEVGRPPVMFLDQEEKALVADLRQLGNFASCARPDLLPDRLEFFEAIIPGDSGNPVFSIINNELVLLTTFTGPGYGTFVTPQLAALNAMIVAADADATARGYPLPTEQQGQTVQTIDLSAFSTYSPP